MAKTIAIICLAISVTSTVRADGTGSHRHSPRSSISTPSLDRRAKQFGDPPPLPNPFFDDAFSAPSFSSNNNFGSSGSFSSDSFSNQQFTSQPQSFSRQPSVVSVNTVFDQPETFRTSGGQSRAPAPEPVTGGIDFSQATRTPDGRLCVIKESFVESVTKDPILECTHKNVEKCHYTYVTQFKPAQEEVCEENFEKKCQITFKQQATTETVKKCYKPLKKVCNGQGPEECRTVYESSCSTRYVEKQQGKFVGDTKCEKLPVEICGAGCITEEQPQECHDKEVTGLVDVPEEVCDLNPQKTCRFATKLVPSLSPKHECTIVPKETCHLKFSQPRVEKKPLKSEWCLDETPTVPDETYDDANALGDPRSGRNLRGTFPFKN